MAEAKSWRPGSVNPATSELSCGPRKGSPCTKVQGRPCRPEDSVTPRRRAGLYMLEFPQPGNGRHGGDVMRASSHCGHRIAVPALALLVGLGLAASPVRAWQYPLLPHVPALAIWPTNP